MIVVTLTMKIEWITSERVSFSEKKNQKNQKNQKTVLLLSEWYCIELSSIRMSWDFYLVCIWECFIFYDYTYEIFFLSLNATCLTDFEDRNSLC